MNRLKTKKVTKISSDNDNIIQLGNLQYGANTAATSRIAGACARKMYVKDISLSANCDPKIIDNMITLPDSPSFIYAIQKLKAHICILDKEVSETTLMTLVNKEGPGFELCQDNSIDAIFNHMRESYSLINNRNYFVFIDKRKGTLTLTDMEHNDYTLTLTEIIFNLKIIRGSDEYKLLHSAFDLVFSLINESRPHNEKVGSMKNLESLCLFRSDIIDANFIAWEPILSVLEDFIKGPFDSSAKQITLNEAVADFIGHNLEENDYCWKLRMLYELDKLSGTDL